MDLGAGAEYTAPFGIAELSDSSASPHQAATAVPRAVPIVARALIHVEKTEVSL